MADLVRVNIKNLIAHIKHKNNNGYFLKIAFRHGDEITCVWAKK